MTCNLSTKFAILYILGHHQWNSDITSGGTTKLGNLPFTLYLMQPNTGFSDDAQGTTQYIDICKRNGLLPVGCGTFTYNCDRNRYNDEPCIPMPDSWGCNMMSSLTTNTGWGINIVALQTDGSSNDFLYKPNGHPTSSENLHPVCGQVRGILRFQRHNWLQVL